MHTTRCTSRNAGSPDRTGNPLKLLRWLNLERGLHCAGRLGLPPTRCRGARVRSKHSRECLNVSHPGASEPQISLRREWFPIAHSVSIITETNVPAAGYLLQLTAATCAAAFFATITFSRISLCRSLARLFSCCSSSMLQLC